MRFLRVQGLGFKPWHRNVYGTGSRFRAFGGGLGSFLYTLVLFQRLSGVGVAQDMLGLASLPDTVGPSSSAS